MDKQNEFKFSTLRQFGSENLSFTATIFSDKQALSTKEIKEQIDQIGSAVTLAFIGVQEREISEKALLVAASERRTAEVAKLDAALKDEMTAKQNAQRTMKEAERLSNKSKK
jgi:hypothetical protein